MAYLKKSGLIQSKTANGLQASKSENKVQQEIVMWYKNNYCLSHHAGRCLIAAIPNGGKRDAQTRMLLAATGVYPGFSDLFIIHNVDTQNSLTQPIVVFIEVKTDTGVQSDDQKNFQYHVNILGFRYHIVRSLASFKKLLANGFN